MGINYINTENILLYMQDIAALVSAAGCGTCSATLNLTVTCASCVVDDNTGRVGDQHHPDLPTTAECAEVIQDCGYIQQLHHSKPYTDQDSTAGAQAIARTMGLPATSVTVKSPPQLTTVQLATLSLATSTPNSPIVKSYVRIHIYKVIGELRQLNS